MASLFASLFCFLFLFNNFMAGNSTVLRWACNGTYPGSNRAYQNNVESVLHNLVDKRNEFSASPVGKPYNGTKAYGMFQCIGDVSQYDCNICAQEARYFLQQKCPLSAGATLWSNWCFLRFESYDFLSKPEIRSANSEPSCGKLGLEKFGGVLRNLMEDVSARAPGDEKFFASKSAGGSFLNLGVEIKGRAQCWRDLSKEACGECVRKGLQEMARCYDKRNSRAEFFSQNCILTYEMTLQGDSSSNPEVRLQGPLEKSLKVRKVESGSSL